MKTAYTNKEIWKIAYPCLISLVMEQLIGMTDTAFLGRVGEVELGASASASVYYMVIFMMGFGFSAGAQIIMARRNGEQNYREVGSVFYHGLYFLMGFAVVMFALSKAVSPLLLEHIIDDPAICAAAESYIDWRIFGFFFSFAAAMFRAFYIGTTQTKTLTLNSIVMVLSNVVFNYILVFGKLGFPALGIAGAAIGSSLCELVSLVFFVTYTVRRIDVAKYGLNRRVRFRWQSLRSIFKVSFWTMIQSFLTLSTWFLFFLFVEHLGQEPLAVSNVVRSVSGFFYMIVAAFAATCGSLVSNLIGAGRNEAVLPTIRQHIRLCYLFVLGLAVVVAVFPTAVISIYTNIPELQAAILPVHIGHGQHAHGVLARGGGSGGLCGLLRVHHQLPAFRRVRLLDHGACLRPGPAGVLLRLHPSRQVEGGEGVEAWNREKGWPKSHGFGTPLYWYLRENISSCSGCRRCGRSTAGTRAWAARCPDTAIPHRRCRRCRDPWPRCRCPHTVRW